MSGCPSSPVEMLPSGPWLNLGSGPFDPEPWVNLDASWQVLLSRVPPLARVAARITGREMGHWPRGVRYGDARRRLPYETGSVAVIYASHIVEHLYRDDARRFLREAHRVLKTGGIVRVVAPDVGAIVGWYLEHAAQPEPNQPSSDLLMDMLMLRPRVIPGCGWLSWIRSGADIHSHKWMYDAAGLTSLLREAGFGSAAPRHYLDSAIPRDALERVELPERVRDGAGVCVEARR